MVQKLISGESGTLDGRSLTNQEFKLFWNDLNRFERLVEKILCRSVDLFMIVPYHKMALKDTVRDLEVARL